MYCSADLFVVGYTQEQVAQFEQNLRVAGSRAYLDAPVGSDAAETTPAVTAKGRLEPKAGNKTEREYGARLEARKRAGEIVSYAYEAVTLKLAFDCRYTPDYLVICSDGTVECHECKGGHVWDDARDKLKTAARLFPWFVFIRAQKKDGRWTVREVKTW